MKLKPSASVNVIYTEQCTCSINKPVLKVEMNGCIYNTNCKGAMYVLGGSAVVQHHKSQKGDLCNN